MKSKCVRCRQADAPKTPFCVECAAWLQSGKFITAGQCQWCGAKVSSSAEPVPVECDECQNSQEDDKERAARMTGSELLEQQFRRVWRGRESK